MTSSVMSVRSADNSARWWSLKSSSSSSPSPLSSLATAIGFKSKKSPTLTIQQPPPLTVRPLTTSPLKPSSRPASKSVSSTRSRGDSIGPKTPIDTGGPILNRQSLLTLSDVDPFAARVSITHSDPNRLFAYSVPGSPEILSKSNSPPINRGSYASSSSHSNFHELSPLSSPLSDDMSPLSPHRNLPLNSDYGSRLLKSDSASTLTDQNRLSQPDPPPKPRPPMRARGMTDGGSGIHPRFFRSEPPLPISSSSSPKVLTRHASARVLGPSTAPPSQELPLPPVVDPNDPHLDINSSPASITFASTVLMSRELVIPNQHYIPRPKTSDLSLRDTAHRGTADPSTRSLQPPLRVIKKAVSQQSLTKSSNVTPSIPPTSSAPTTPSESNDKSLRKQRSFHHPRIPLPSIPLLHSPPTSQATSPIDTPESRRSSGHGPRKRLFSSSSTRRPSTSAEDDAHSIFSLRSESHAKIANVSTSNVVTLSNINTNQPSFWDESGQVTPSSPEWQPQQIMSPAEVAKLEAKIEEERAEKQRQRTMSIQSSSTVFSVTSLDRDFGSSSTANARIPARSSSLLVQHPPEPSKSSRPATAQGSISHSESGMISLKPPPRSWQRPSTATADPQTVIQPLSPPPRRIRRKASAEHTSFVDKATRRRSIMRKPSFLDIDDDKDAETDSQTVGKGARKLEDSFLDLARESFDTIRSSEE